jgi:chromate transporter
MTDSPKTPVISSSGETAPKYSLWQMVLYALKLGSIGFGGPVALVGYMHRDLVEEKQWISEAQYSEGMMVAQVASVAGLATFLPCYLFTIVFAPYLKKHGKQPGIAAFVNGVTTAATGAIVGAVIVLGRRSLIDFPTILIAVVTLALLWKFKQKLPEPVIVVIAAVVGLVIYPLTHPLS